MRTFDQWHNWGTARKQAADYLPSVTLARLDDAVAFAQQCHGDQKRPAGEPYVEHLLEVLEILVLGAGVTDDSLLVAAVLHDTVEDTHCTAEEIETKFGVREALLVRWVTKPEAGPGEDAAVARRRYLESLRSGPRDAVLLKLADRLSNVQRLDTHPRPNKRRSYYLETCEYVLPMAAGVPWFQDIFAEWRERYRYLDDDDPATEKLGIA